MASLTVSAPCNISSLSSLAGRKVPKAIGVQQKIVMMNGAKPLKALSVQSEAAQIDEMETNEMQRRSVMFGAVAAVVSAVSGGIAIAGSDPKAEPRSGTPEAKKLYARVCATMPTARVCHY